VDLAHALAEIEESPWGDLRGRALDARGLADRLRPKDIRPRTIRIGEDRAKGYDRADFADAWSRYLPSRSDGQSERDTVTPQVRPHIQSPEPESVSWTERASDQGSHGVTDENPNESVTEGNADLDRAEAEVRLAFGDEHVTVVPEGDPTAHVRAAYTEQDREAVSARYEILRKVYPRGPA
jgi:hypothetical protein